MLARAALQRAATSAPGLLAGARRALVYRINQEGPAPRRIFGFIWNSKVPRPRGGGRRLAAIAALPASLPHAQIVVFYMGLFIFPTIGAVIYTGGRTQLSREDLLKSDAAKEHVRRRRLETCATTHKGRGTPLRAAVTRCALPSSAARLSGRASAVRTADEEAGLRQVRGGHARGGADGGNEQGALPEQRHGSDAVVGGQTRGQAQGPARADGRAEEGTGGTEPWIAWWRTFAVERGRCSTRNPMGAPRASEQIASRARRDDAR